MHPENSLSYSTTRVDRHLSPPGGQEGSGASSMQGWAVAENGRKPGERKGRPWMWYC